MDGKLVRLQGSAQEAGCAQPTQTEGVLGGAAGIVDHDRNPWLRLLDLFQQLRRGPVIEGKFGQHEVGSGGPQLREGFERTRNKIAAKAGKNLG
jgi:hypothetical protein